MIVRSAQSRSGITLTEILISILIMGVGIVSLATLFPLGLIRLRKANEQSRSGYLIESAIADLGTRDLLTPLSIVFNPKIAPYYVATSGQYSPFIQDTPSLGADWGPPTAPAGAYRGYGGALNLQVQNFPPRRRCAPVPASPSRMTPPGGRLRISSPRPAVPKRGSAKASVSPREPRHRNGFASIRTARSPARAASSGSRICHR